MGEHPNVRSPLRDMFGSSGNFSLRRTQERSEIPQDVYYDHGALFGRPRNQRTCFVGPRLGRRRRIIVAVINLLIAIFALTLLICAILKHYSKHGPDVKDTNEKLLKPDIYLMAHSPVSSIISGDEDSIKGESMESLSPLDEGLPYDIEPVNDRFVLGDINILSRRLSHAVHRYRRSLFRASQASLGQSNACLDDNCERVNEIEGVANSNFRSKLDKMLEEIHSIKRKLKLYEENLLKLKNRPFHAFYNYLNVRDYPETSDTLRPIKVGNNLYPSENSDISTKSDSSPKLPNNTISLGVTGQVYDDNNAVDGILQQANASNTTKITQFTLPSQETTAETTPSLQETGSFTVAYDIFDDTLGDKPNADLKELDLQVAENSAEKNSDGDASFSMKSTTQLFNADNVEALPESNITTEEELFSPGETTPTKYSEKMSQDITRSNITTEEELFSPGETTPTKYSEKMLQDITTSNITTEEELFSPGETTPTKYSEKMSLDITTLSSVKEEDDLELAKAEEKTSSELSKKDSKDVLTSTNENSFGDNIRGISLHEATIHKTREENKKQWGSRVVSKIEDVKQPTAPDSSLTMGEATSSGHQLTITPSAFSPVVIPYQICFFGQPNMNINNKGLPTIRQNANARTLDFPFPQFHSFPLNNMPLTTLPPHSGAQPTVFNVIVNNYPNHVTAPSVSFPISQSQSNSPGMSMFPSQQHVARYYDFQKQPLICTAIQAPLFQYPTVPGTSEFSHSRCLNCTEEPAILKGSQSKVAVGGEEEGGDLECPEGTSQCRDNQLCIPSLQWCDGRVHCLDASDERYCSCRDRISDVRLCDGYPDCPGGEDEEECFGCPTTEFSCQTHDHMKTCIPMSKRCDGHPDCVSGLDEEHCVLLTDSPRNTSYYVTYSEGFLLRNWRGIWYPVCKEKGRQSWAESACATANNNNNGDIDVEFRVLPENIRGPFLVHQEDGNFILRHHCGGHLAMHVRCPTMLCGVRANSKEILEEKQFLDRFRRLIQQKDAPTASDRPFAEWMEKMVEDVEKKFNVHDVTAALVPIPVKEVEGADNKRKTEGVSNRRKRDEMVKVVGGRKSTPTAWPWAAALYKDGSFYCGGVILDKEWILTAAHCVTDFWDHYFEVRIGMIRRSSFSPIEQIIRVSHIIIHEKYDQQTMQNDLAVIRMAKNIAYSRWVRPICLPAPENSSKSEHPGPKPGSRCIAIGWGALKEHGLDPDQLQEVILPIMNRCKHRQDVEGDEICAGINEGGKDTCQGDSGGPLMCKDSVNSWYVAGVVSHGEGCARPYEPGAYTRVSLFIDWLASKTSGPLPIQVPKQNCPGFQCYSHPGMCIAESFRCNGYVDCYDGEDEVYCNRFRSDEEFEKADESTQDLLQTYREKLEEDISIFNYTHHMNLKRWFKCKTMGQRILDSKRCDGVQDCEDSSDELNCSCRQKLLYTSYSSICDGIIDCEDSTDEVGCYECPEDFFNCRRSKQCLRSDKQCDKIKDCLLGEDEAFCNALSADFHVVLNTNLEPTYSTLGFLLQNKKGLWGVKCENESVKARRDASETCEELGLTGVDTISNILVPEAHFRVDIKGEELVDEIVYHCKGVYIQCNPHLRSLRKPPGSDFWDWEARIRVDGEIVCTAALITSQWLFASSQCFGENISLTANYISAEMGLRVLPSLIIRIDYYHRLPNSDITFLHLSYEVPQEIYHRPLQIPYYIDNKDLKSCIAVSNKSVVDLKQTYDSCGDDNICFTRSKRPKRGCRSSPWIGVVVCYSSEGWLPVSAFMEIGGKCGFQSSTMTNMIRHIKAIENILAEESLVEASEPECSGFRCVDGRCISMSEVCNGWPNCPYGDDEHESACAEKKFTAGCLRDQIRCSNGSCIPRSQYGDDIPQCPNAEDEPAQKNCANYLRLVAPHRICDGNRNCKDKTDEDPNICGCSLNSYKCTGSTKCIPNNFVCDNQKDCPDGDDEKNCLKLKRVSKSQDIFKVMNISYGVMHTACDLDLSESEGDILCQRISLKFAISLKFEFEKPITPEIDSFTYINFNNITTTSLRGDRPFISLKRGSSPCQTTLIQCG